MTHQYIIVTYDGVSFNILVNEDGNAVSFTSREAAEEYAEEVCNTPWRVCKF